MIDSNSSVPGLDDRELEMKEIFTPVNADDFIVRLHTRFLLILFNFIGQDRAP